MDENGSVQISVDGGRRILHVRDWHQSEEPERFTNFEMLYTKPNTNKDNLDHGSRRKPTPVRFNSVGHARLFSAWFLSGVNQIGEVRGFLWHDAQLRRMNRNEEFLDALAQRLASGRLCASWSGETPYPFVLGPAPRLQESTFPVWSGGYLPQAAKPDKPVRVPIDAVPVPAATLETERQLATSREPTAVVVAQDAQANALRAAAKDGTPFCAVCEVTSTSPASGASI